MSGENIAKGRRPWLEFLCAPFFQNGVVAVDASVPAMAFAVTRDQLSLDGAVSRLALDGERVTLDGKIFAVAYQVASSMAQHELGDQRPGRHGRADLTVSLPGSGDGYRIRPRETNQDWDCRRARPRLLVSLGHGIRLRGE